MHPSIIVLAVLFLVATSIAVGVWIGFFFSRRREEQAAQALTEQLKGYCGKWVATGMNADIFDAKSGTCYIDVPMVRMPSSGDVSAWEQSEVLCIPNIGHSPKKGEVMLVRLRAPSDPQPPHWRYLGCYLFAATYGYSL